MAASNKNVLIVASGPSVAALAPGCIAAASKAGILVACVNRAVEWSPACDVWFTLDPDERVRSLVDAPADYAKYVAVPDDYGRPNARVRYHRNARLPKDVFRLRRVSGAGPLGSRYGLSEERRVVHTGNSVYGCLGLIYHNRPPRVALVGVDGTTAEYGRISGAPRTRMDHLPDLFASALPQLCAAGIAVRNGSPTSRVTCFGRCAPSDAIRWLMIP